VILGKEYSEWAFEHYEVNYIHLDCRFGFDLYGFSGSDGYLKIVVDVPFTLSDGDAEIRFDPEDLSTIGGALRILHKLAHKSCGLSKWYSQGRISTSIKPSSREASAV